MTTKEDPTLLWHARWTFPLHVLLALIAWRLATADPELAANAFLWLHIALAVGFLATARWWWSRVTELMALVLLNHGVTWATLWLVSALAWES